MRKPPNSLLTFFFILIGFAFYYFLFQQFKYIKASLDKYTEQGLLSYIIIYFIIGIPIFAATRWINFKDRVIVTLGLSKNVFKGISFGLFFSMPMLIGYSIFYDINREVDIQDLIAGTIIAGLMEEIYFRGYLFGMIFRFTKIGFIPAILIASILFALGHLYQASTFAQLIGVFSVTFMGSVFLAWLFCEWEYNLWVPIFTHAGMNFSWMIYNVDSSALGSEVANIFRAMTIALAIIFTIYYKKRNHSSYQINKNTLWYKKR